MTRSLPSAYRSGSFTELGDTRFALASRSDLAHALRRGGRLDEAMAMYRETIGGWVHLGQKGAIANQLENIAYVEVERGSSDRATSPAGCRGRDPGSLWLPHGL